MFARENKKEKGAETTFFEAVPASVLKNPNDAPPPLALTPEQDRALYRKIDIRLMPILSLMYLLSFMDRGNARLQGLETQLGLTGNKYNVALVSPVPSCLFEGLVLKKFRPSRWLPGITVLWGIVMTCMGLVKNYPQLVGCRVCLGVAEAGLFPGVTYFLTLWYPRYDIQYRVGLFFGAATIAGAFSGLLAYGIGFMSGTHGLLGWSWIFILEGIATVAVGILSFFVLHGCDAPGTASFLTPEERAYVIWRKSDATTRCIGADFFFFCDVDGDSHAGEDEDFSLKYIRAAFLDWQVWVHILIYMSVVAPLYGCALFLPFGYSTAVSQLLTVPLYVFGTLVLLTFSLLSDRLKMRSPFIVAAQLMALVGFSINAADVPSGAKYFGMFLCVAGAYASFPGVIAWLGNNLAPQYKRAVGMALHIGIGNFSGAIASNIYRKQDAPRYVLGHAVELGFLGMGLVLTPLTAWIYSRINAHRDAVQGSDGKYDSMTAEELKALGDRAPNFRYSL
ncbi:hypothetical protein BOTBODRAFT_99811 [Botryobasidium botryosum FD-172 SS1]|uniref:Major facilitator superfamily (MFS) profile domain-containing protein n=1 Tax=Botryobasidium botryosum (strain FD-172 SS1) TaxID=930990 RepID=A0A067N4H3_BOTB1|nr:hypothetical protein BOTBODRAFT_99811 [Botryobasidium botryosum FD-172 SS1]